MDARFASWRRRYPGSMVARLGWDDPTQGVRAGPPGSKPTSAARPVIAPGEVAGCAWTGKRAVGRAAARPARRMTRRRACSGATTSSSPAVSSTGFATALATETGGPLDRWGLRGDGGRRRRGRRLGSGTRRRACSGRTLAVVSDAGALVRRNEPAAFSRRSACSRPATRIVFVEATKSNAKGPRKGAGRCRAAAVVAGDAGRWRRRPTGLGAWIERRGARTGLGPRTGRRPRDRCAERLAAVDRGRRRSPAPGGSPLVELDKLALYRDGAPVTPDDVRALVTETVPASVWALTDAVGDRHRVRPLQRPTPPRRPRRSPSSRRAPSTRCGATGARTTGSRGGACRSPRGRWGSRTSSGRRPSRVRRSLVGRGAQESARRLLELDAMVKGVPGRARTWRSGAWRSRCGSASTERGPGPGGRRTKG